MALDYISEIAFHEAAHAVVAAHLKMPFRYATAVASKGFGDGGHVTLESKRVRLYLRPRSGPYRRRSDEEIKAMGREHDHCDAVVTLAARAALENMAFEDEDGTPLPPCEGQYECDEKDVRTIADDLGVDDFAAWRERQLQRAREIVALPHVRRAIDLVAKYLEVERVKHANGTGNGRLAAKEFAGYSARCGRSRKEKQRRHESSADERREPRARDRHLDEEDGVTSPHKCSKRRTTMHEEYNTEELRERAELTDRIVANLETINADKIDLDELANTTGDIVRDLDVIARADAA